MSSLHSFSTGKGAHKRQSHHPPVSGAKFEVQAKSAQLPHYPFQPLPKPNGPAPYRFDLSQLLSAADIARIKDAGAMVCHTVGDTGDYRGQQQDFVADMLTRDAQQLTEDRKPAFYYHLGDVVYFAGDIDKYGDNFYETYKDYPCFIVAIRAITTASRMTRRTVRSIRTRPHWMGGCRISWPAIPARASARRKPHRGEPRWTCRTSIGPSQRRLPRSSVCFRMSERPKEEMHPDQVNWFGEELTAADPNLALIVAVHHPPYSGDTEHSGSTEVHTVLFDSFKATKRYPNLILSGHVHNYQRFTDVVAGPKSSLQIPCVVAGAGGYTNLGKLHKVDGQYPAVPLPLGNGLTLEQYDQDNFGFLRLEVSSTQILATYFSAPYSQGATPAASVVDRFVVDLGSHTVRTLS